MIGTGDTSTKDPLTGGERNVALPLFVRQNSGPALRGGGDCGAQPASLISGGGGKRRCASRRHFTIHIKRRILRGDRVKRATIYLNGKRVKRVRIRGKRAIRIDLRGRRKGAFTITVQGAPRRAAGCATCAATTRARRSAASTTTTITTTADGARQGAAAASGGRRPSAAGVG
jgi:hypothetical protein